MLQRLSHLLGTETLSSEQIVFILDQAKPFQEFQRHPLKKLATLRGKTVALAFFETSTRTRISFTTRGGSPRRGHNESAGRIFEPEKGRIALDTVRTLEAMRPDGIVIRHASSGAPEFVAQRLEIPGAQRRRRHARASHAGAARRSDIRDRKGTLEGWNVTILGDILHSRVARSNIHLLGKFGRSITLCGPAMWVPRELEKLAPGVRVVHRIDEALEGADVVMVLRVQTERIHEPSLAPDEYISGYPADSRAPARWRDRMLWCCIPARSFAASKSIPPSPTARSPACSSK